jgi:hypothetical protein
MNRGVVVLFIATLCVVTAYTLSKRSYYDSKHPLIGQIKAKLALLDPSYARIPLREGDSAYTENKEVITLCLADPDEKKFYDMNTLMYVTLHEVAHVISKSQGHGDEFKQNFATLLRRGAEIGIYDPRKPIPSTYCKVATGK